MRAEIRDCSKHVFLFKCFDSGALLTPGLANELLERAYNSPGSVPFVCKSTNPEPTLPDHLPLTLKRHPGHPPALITQGLGPRQLGTFPTPQSLLQFFKLASPTLADPACLAFPRKPQRRLLPTLFPCSLCLLTNSGAFLRSPVWHGVPSVFKDL